MLKKVELDKIKKELVQRKKELEDELRHLTGEKMTDTQSQDDADQIVFLTMEALRSSLQDAEYNEYTMILSALKSIDDGSYGTCQDCGEPISEKRLKYYPNARRCLACQQLLEEQSKG